MARISALPQNDSRVAKIYKSDFRIAMKGNKPDILLRGANDDGGDSLRGLKLYFFGGDEVQDIKLSVINEVIIPALVDSEGSSALYIGTPKGKTSQFYQFAMDAKTTKNWAYFHKTTFDNPFLDAQEVENNRKKLPPKIFNQEFLASWESFGGQIYSELDEHHLIDPDQLPEKFDYYYLGIDWGDVHPACVLVGKKSETYYVLETWTNPNPESAIEQHTHNQAISDLAQKYPIAKAFADPSQPARILNVRKTLGLKIVSGNNKLEAGNGVVNALLFQNRLFISKNCQQFYEKLGSYHRQVKDGIILDMVAPKQDGHEIDSLRYIIFSLESFKMDLNTNPLLKLVEADPAPVLPKPINKTGIYNKVHYA